MNIKDIQISFIGMEPTEALKKYSKEKISKYEHLLEEATSMEVLLKQFKSSRGVKDDFRVNFSLVLPKSVVRVEVNGENMYAIIDQASDTLARRIKRYQEKKSYWEGITPWKVIEADANMDEIKDDNFEQYSDYTPTIATRKKIDDMTPLEEGEAIERMELLGYDQYLFKNKATGKFSMIYKRVKGGYGLVEPADSEI